MESDYIHAVACGDIMKDIVVLMISMDRAQLYETHYRRKGYASGMPPQEPYSHPISISFSQLWMDPVSFILMAWLDTAVKTGVVCIVESRDNARSGSSLEYATNLKRLVAAPNETQYCKLMKEMGLMKPSLLIGLDLKHMLGIDYTPPDHPLTWPWAIFQDVDMWQAHGAAVAAADLQAAHTAFNEWEVEFKLLYSECHLITQTFQKGPPIYYLQWTMEHTVGNLGQEIGQPSNPYSNLSWEGVCRCQVNALKAMIPELDVPPRGIPSTAIDLGSGYVLLWKRDYCAVHPSQAETIAIEAYLGLDAHKIHWWDRLRLPNGQIVQTAWRETLRPPERPIHVSCNVKYFTWLAAESGVGEDEPIWSWKDVAIIVMYSQPDADLLDLSFQASIKAVVGMVPHTPRLPSGVVENRFFLVEKLGLDIATFGVPYEGPCAQDDEDDDDEENMDVIE
ncbi:hypothetical protein DFH29DRAFT_880324 [Suillus ampliporus]|nr:hypothetical protein DFH29DRAFT_880324 [Suillus ampliporus]